MGPPFLFYDSKSYAVQEKDYQEDKQQSEKYILKCVP